MTPYTEVDAEAEFTDAVTRQDWSRVEQLGAWLDAHPRVPSVYGSALWYAQQGLRVFPIMALSKRPYPGTRGLHDASSDPEQVRAWWERWPDANLAIATGHLVDVIDFDGLQGHTSWARRFGPSDPEVYGCEPCGYQWNATWYGRTTCNRCGAPGAPWVHPEDGTTRNTPDGSSYGGAPVLGTVSTPRPGGMHVYIAATGSGNYAGMLPGVDYRGRGGYVLAPPSVLDDREDQHPGTYQWLRPLNLKEPQ